MRKHLCFFLAILLVMPLLAVPTSATEHFATNATYFNDAEFPASDPAVLFDTASGYYYVYSTDGGSTKHHFGIYRSADLTTWEYVGGALQKNAAPWGHSWFSSPECYYNQETGWYFLLYSARLEAGTEATQQAFGDKLYAEPCRIGIAKSRSPEGPFVNIADTPIDFSPYDPSYYDVDTVMTNPLTPPSTKRTNVAQGTYVSITDPHMLFENGHIYLYYTRNAYHNWVWDTALGKYVQESQIHGVELTADWWNDTSGNTLPTVTSSFYNANKGSSDPPTVRKDGFVPLVTYGMEPLSWENAQVNSPPYSRRSFQSPCVISYREGNYYMIYSVNDHNYNGSVTAYAVADSPLGPWNKCSTAPLITDGTSVSGAGGGSVVSLWSLRGTEFFYVYSGKFGNAGGQRLMMDRMLFDFYQTDPDTGIDSLSVTQTTTDQPIPLGFAPYKLQVDKPVLSVTPDSQKNISCKVLTSLGVEVPLSSEKNRVVASVANSNVASATVQDGTVCITGQSIGKTTLTLQYQRKSADGSYYDVIDEGEEGAAPVSMTIPIFVSDVYASEIDHDVYANELFSFTVVTGEEVTDLRLYNENGGRVSIHQLSSTVTNIGKVWYVTMAVGTPGPNRILNIHIYTQQNGDFADSNACVTFTVIARQPMVRSMVFSASSVPKNETFYATLITNSVAGAVKIVNHNGGEIGKTLVSKTVLPDGDIEWVYSLRVGTAGQNRVFRAFAGVSSSSYNEDPAAIATATITIV